MVLHFLFGVFISLIFPFPNNLIRFIFTGFGTLFLFFDIGLVVYYLAVLKAKYKSEIFKTLFNEIMKEVDIEKPLIIKNDEEIKSILSNSFFSLSTLYKYKNIYEGKVEGVKFAAADYCLENKNKEREEKIRRHGKEYEFFKILGKVIYFDFNNIPFIFNDIDENSGIFLTFDKKSKAIDEMISLKSLTKVEFEFYEFNEKFDCFTNNKELTFKIIKPSVILSIINLSESLKNDFKNNEYDVTFSFLILIK